MVRPFAGQRQDEYEGLRVGDRSGRVGRGQAAQHGHGQRDGRRSLNPTRAWLIVAILLLISATGCNGSDATPSTAASPTTREASPSTTVSTLPTEDTSPRRETSTTAVVGTTATVPAGETAEVAGVNVEVLGESSSSDDTVTVSLVDNAPPLPNGVVGIGAGPVEISASQGEPSGAVIVTFPYRSTAISAGSRPLVVHFYEDFGLWLAEETIRIDPSEETITVSPSSFSIFTVVDEFTFQAQLLLGNRTTARPEGCQPAPDWVQNVQLHDGKNDPVPACGHASGSDRYTISLAGNRGYPQIVRSTGIAPESHSNGYSLNAEDGVAQLAKSASDAVYISPGSVGSVTFARPSEAHGTVPVSLEARVDKGLTAVYVVREIAEQIADVVNVDVLNRLMVGCVESATGGSLPDLIVRCGVPSIKDAITISKGPSVGAAIDRLLATYVAAKYVSQIISAAGGAAGLDDVGSFEVSPLTDLGTVVPATGKINRTPAGEAWFIDPRGYRHRIADGGTYECLAGQGLQVVESVDSVLIEGFVLAEDAVCVRIDNGDIAQTSDGDSYLMEGGKRRYLSWLAHQCETLEHGRTVVFVPRYWVESTPSGDDYPDQCGATTTTVTTTTTASTTTTSRPVVLPQKGKINRTPDGEAWYIDPRGYRHQIPDGGTYECLVAQGKQVVNGVEQWRIEAFGAAESAECVRADNGTIVRTDDGDSYVMESGKRRWIPSGEVYQCELALGRRLVDSVPRYWIEDTPVGSDYPLRCLPQKGKVNKATDGSSWYIDPRGYRHHIPDGGTYDCLVAQGYGVQVGVSRTRINAFTRTEDAQCVRAGNGDIIRHDDGDAYLLESGKRRWITDGVTYECLKKEGHRVVDHVPRYYIENTSRGSNVSKTCYPWNTYGKVIIHPDGDSHYVDGNGVRHWIPDTATYRCRIYQGTATMSASRAQINGLSEGSWDYCNNRRAWAGMILRHQIDGDAHYIDGSAIRHWIPDGGVYTCLVNKGKVVVNTRYRQYIDLIPEGSRQTCS